ncbi:hypothetical protein Q757_08505, partial [Oenococcus alcoholitolerans]
MKDKKGLNNRANKIYDARFIANFIVDQNPNKVSNLMLQKILYYVKIYFLVKCDRNIFSNSMEKWEYGPVIPDVYHEFNNYGSEPINAPQSLFVDEKDYTKGDRKVFGFYLHNYTKTDIEEDDQRPIEDISKGILSRFRED